MKGPMEGARVLLRLGKFDVDSTSSPSILYTSGFDIFAMAKEAMGTCFSSSCKIVARDPS